MDVMDLSFLQSYYIPVIAGICLCIGYIIKSSLGFIPNKYIPLIVGVLGLLTNIAINKTVSADIVLGVLFSGLSSTGMYEMLKNIIKG